jgi:hypothetical protein
MEEYLPLPHFPVVYVVLSYSFYQFELVQYSLVGVIWFVHFELWFVGVDISALLGGAVVRLVYFIEMASAVNKDIFD